jgi:hypothetical protein
LVLSDKDKTEDQLVQLALEDQSSGQVVQLLFLLRIQVLHHEEAHKSLAHKNSEVLDFLDYPLGLFLHAF